MHRHVSGVLGAVRPAFFIVLFASFILAPLSVDAFAGGDGSQGDPWQITDWEDLDDMRDSLTSHYVLINDIDEDTVGYDTYGSSAANSGSGWLPVGVSASAFKGTFDGGGFTISGLYVNRSATSYIGLFGHATGTSVTISDVTVENATLIGNQYVGGIVGRGGNGITLDDVHFEGTIQSNYNLGSALAGGVAGSITGSPNSTVRDSSADVSITLKSGTIGGFAGEISSISVTNSSASTTLIKTTSDFAGTLGGFVGSLGTGGSIASSSAKVAMDIGGNVTFKDDYGGFVGFIQQGATVRGSFSTGSITVTSGSGSYHGGFVGRIANGTVSDSYTRVSVSSIGEVGGFIGGHTSASVKSIIRSYAAGALTTSSSTVTAKGFLSQAVGSNMTLTDNYWDTTVGPATSVGEGSGAITGVSTSLMKQRGTFANWNFTNTWGINNVSPASNNNGYPFLRWQDTLTHAYNLASVTTDDASSIGQTSVTLNGTITSAETGVDITVRGFEYGTTDSYGSTFTSGEGTWDEGAFSTTLADLVCGTTYHFRTTATVTDGDEEQELEGDDETFTTSTCPPQSSGSSSGSSVSNRVKNLLSNNNTQAAAEIMSQYPDVFANQSVTPSTPAVLLSVRDLELGIVGDDVLMLQKLLNAVGFTLATEGVGSVGQETNYFGSLTRDALIRYQQANAISPAIGYFGPITRAQMKSAGLAGLWW